MSGQKEQSFRVAPGYTGADVNPAPTQRTQGFQATPAQVGSNAQGLNAIGNALGSFFGNAAKSVDSVGDIMHREELVQIGRENESLAKQGHIDQATGQTMDPKMAERHTYYGAYQTAAADQSANELGTLLKQRLGAMKLDGSEDPQAISEQFYKDQVGKGTGDREYDDRLLAQFGRQAQSQVNQYGEAITQTVKQNTTQTIITTATQSILKGEMNAGKLADVREQIATVSSGDRKVGDQILFAALSGVQNDGQATSVLKSMQELGMDKEYPDQFNKLSGLMLERTNRVKTYDAGLAVQNFQMDLARDRGKYRDGILPPEKAIEYQVKWFGIDSVHGVGMEGSGIHKMLEQGVAREVRQNAWDLAYSGKLGTQMLSRVASSLDETPDKVLGKDYDSAVSRQLVASSPALRASVDGTNIVNPMASDAAAKDYASFVLTPGHRMASDDRISDTFKTTMGAPLRGKDPAAMARSFTFYNDLLQGGMTSDQLHRYFPDATTENHFWGMQGLSQGGLAVTQIAKDLTDYPHDQKVLDAATVNGHVNLAKLSGLTEKPEVIDQKIMAARNGALLESADRKRLFGRSDIGMDSNESAKFDALLANQFMLMQRGGKTVDLDVAIANVAKQTGGYLVTPTAFGGLQAYKDPYGGRGRTLLQPLNADASGPLSISKGFRPIYALGAKVTNAIGEQEDTLVTWAEDAAHASKQFPGRIPDGEKLYLERQDVNGLSMVKDSTGQMVQFMPGQRIVLATRPQTFGEKTQNALSPLTAPVLTRDYAVEAEVPKDPKAASEFFRKNLGPGWEAIQKPGFDGPDGKGWVLHYAPRVKVGETERDARIAQRRTDAMQFQQERAGVTGTVDTGGGAALRFTNATGSAKASANARTDTTNSGPTWGEIGGSVSDAAGAVVGKYGEIATSQVEALQDGWKALEGSKRLDNAKGLFRKE